MIKSLHMLNISTDVRLNTVDSLTGLVAYTIVGDTSACSTGAMCRWMPTAVR